MGRHLRSHGTLPRPARALAGDPQGAHVRADRWNRRGAHDVAPRGARRRAQLGLPLLLAARRDADAPCPRAGYAGEAQAWRDWLLRAIAGHPSDIQIMYGIAGERRLTEVELGWLDGYEGSRPVRVGNAACDQLQLDVYGEVGDALYHARGAGLGPSPDAWALNVKLLDWLEVGLARARRGDLGGARASTPVHALEGHGLGRLRPCRASVEEHGLDGPVDRWRVIRDEVHDEVCRLGFDAGVGAFTQSYGSKRLDASLLLMPLVGFLPRTTRGSWGRLRRSSGTWCGTGSSSGIAPTGRTSPSTASPGRGDVPSLLVLARPGADAAGPSRKPSGSSSGSSRSATTSACSPRSTTPCRAVSSGTSRRRSRTSHSSTRR